MKEENRPSVGPGLGFSVSQDTGTPSDKLIPRGNDIVDLVTDVVEPTSTVAFEEPPYW